MSSVGRDSSDEDYVPDEESEDVSENVGERGTSEVDVEVGPALLLGSALMAVDEDDDNDTSDDAGEIEEDEDAGDFDDGMEEDESTASGANIRRPVSIQEFLALRLLGRMPRGSRSEDPQCRYPAHEDVTPQALTRGPLWQQITLATAAAGLARRNSWAHFDSCLDASMDCSMQASRAAALGKYTRQTIMEAVRTDPRVAALVTMLGPPTPPQAPETPEAAAPTLPSASASSPASAPAAGAGGIPAPTLPSPSCTAHGCGTPEAKASPKGKRPLERETGSESSPGPPGSKSGSGSLLGSLLGFGAGRARAADGARGAAAPQPAAPRSAQPAEARPVDVVPEGYLGGSPVVPAPRLVMRREQGEAAGPGGGWSPAQMRHMQCYRALPRYPRAVVDGLDSRAYIGQFSADGQFFVAAFQDRRVRLYDVERGWRLRKDITTRMCRWTITDTSVSPDQRFVIYSSIIPIVHLVEVGSSYDCINSIANITQIHEPLNFDDTVNPNGGDFRLGRSFGIWSVQWSGDGREIVAGTNDQSVVVLDVETKRVVARAEGHDNDVNAVTYADSSPNIIVSGSDDMLIKVWDRRVMPATPPGGQGSSAGGDPARVQPVGVLVGHTEGLTHLHSRGDGRHVLSNCKDQTAKLWDIRMVQAGGSLRSASVSARLSQMHVPHFDWDYRWQEYPAAGRVVRHPHDTSVQTYRGHTVQHTLIRAYFSPEHSTGQRFVYTGSVEGGVHVYDMVSGQQVEGSPFRLHRKLVRDVSWHPFEPVMATVSWDGTVVRWDAVPPAPGTKGPMVPGRDAFNDYY